MLNWEYAALLSDVRREYMRAGIWKGMLFDSVHLAREEPDWETVGRRYGFALDYLGMAETYMCQLLAHLRQLKS